MRAGIKMVWIICVPIVLVYMTMSGFLVRIFIENPSEIALTTGVQFLRIVTPFYFVISVKLIADGILRGAGLMKQFMISTFTDLILRVVLALVFSGLFGAIGIWCAWPVGWTIATGMSVFFYKKNFRSEIKKKRD